MDDDLDELLQTGLLQAPEDFTARVMRRIDELPAPTTRSRAWEALRWAAVIGASLLAVAQLAGFMFGIWAAVSAA